MLAEGSGLTNGDTAVLILGLIRTGFHDSRTSYISKYWNIYSAIRTSGGLISNQSALRINLGSIFYTNEAKQVGVSVSHHLSLFFSPEAMGWPWELVRTRVRRF